jgi:AraC-like DNA-binding protein
VHASGNVLNAQSPVRLVRIHTDEWPERERVARFREMHGGDRVRVAPARDEPLRIDATIVRFPSLALLWGRRSPLRSEFADGNDRLLLNLGGPAIARQFGREIPLERGDAIALSGTDRGTLTTLQTGRIATLEFPNGALLPSLKDPHDACARRIAKDSLPLRLLRGYLRTVCASDFAESRLPPMTVAHMYDLAATTVGAAREAEEIANGRGVRVARLNAIKRDIVARLDRDIALDELAARHHVSTRYVRMLFQSEGTTVTDFVLGERLKRAHSMLMNPRFDSRRIADVAYAVGFNDLSYFNRTFRRRFGRAPGEVRLEQRVFRCAQDDIKSV